MSFAYVDSSILAAIVFEEDGSETFHAWLAGFDGLMCSDLVEAEVKSACFRERATLDPTFFSNIDWILPNRALSPEISNVLAVGYLTGADLWHVATALYYASDPSEVGFLTLDMRQRNVARELGFQVERAAGEESLS